MRVAFEEALHKDQMNLPITMAPSARATWILSTLQIWGPFPGLEAQFVKTSNLAFGAIGGPFNNNLVSTRQNVRIPAKPGVVKHSQQTAAGLWFVNRRRWDTGTIG